MAVLLSSGFEILPFSDVAFVEITMTMIRVRQLDKNDKESQWRSLYAD